MRHRCPPKHRDYSAGSLLEQCIYGACNMGSVLTCVVQHTMTATSDNVQYSHWRLSCTFHKLWLQSISASTATPLSSSNCVAILRRFLSPAVPGRLSSTTMHGRSSHQIRAQCTRLLQYCTFFACRRVVEVCSTWYITMLAAAKSMWVKIAP